MPIITVWDNEVRTIIRKDFTDPWTWDDYAAAYELSIQMLVEQPHPVGIILDVTQSLRVPEAPLIHLRRILANGLPPNWAGTVVVGGSAFVNSLVSIVSRGRAHYQQLTTAPTLEAARERLNQGGLAGTGH